MARQGLAQHGVVQALGAFSVGWMRAAKGSRVVIKPELLQTAFDVVALYRKAEGLSADNPVTTVESELLRELYNNGMPHGVLISFFENICRQVDTKNGPLYELYKKHQARRSLGNSEISFKR